MGLRALAAVLAVLDVLLGVVPGAAAGGHGDGDEQAGDDDAEQHGADGRQRIRLTGDRQDHPVEHDRREHRQHRRHDHLLDRGLGQHVDATPVVRLRRALHDARDLLELAAHLHHHRARRPADRGHAERAEQIGQEAAHQQADHHVGVGQSEVDPVADVNQALLGKVLDVQGVGGEQDQRAEARRADGIALGDRLGGVADRVQGVGGLAHLGLEVGHFGDAAGVVGDRAVGVERHHHAGQRDHRGDRDRDPEQAGQEVRGDDPGDDDERRNRGRLHGYGEALDHVRAVARGRSLGDAAHRAILGAGVVLGHPDERAGDRQADQTAVIEVARRDGPVVEVEHGLDTEHPIGDEPEQNGGDHARDDDALVERAHDVLACAQAHEEGADDRSDDAGAADHQRIAHDVGNDVAAGEEDRGQQHGRDHGDRVGLEEVRGHARAVADVVADVVGDDRRVARIVLRNAGLDLADQVGADVRALGEDAAAQAGEDRDQRGAEAQADQRIDEFAALGAQGKQDAVVARDRQQGEARDQHAGHRAGAERDGQTLGQPLTRGLGGAHVGAHRHVHADVAGRARQHRADQIANADREIERERHDQEDHGADHGDRAVLAVEVGLGAFLDRRGDGLHARRARVGAQDGAGRPDSVRQRQHAAGEDKQQLRRHVDFPYFDKPAR